MKTKIGILGVLIGILSLGILFTQPALSQNTLQFTSVNATPEKAIQLHWTSKTNEIYEIDYANALATNADGSTAWFPLIDDYPAHQGSNTFWLDTGNYNLSPIIPPPKDAPMRFYRVVLTGTNTSGDNPSVAITYPTNGAVLSGDVTVTVSASSDQVLATVDLYVDGQKMWSSDDNSNFVINISGFGIRAVRVQVIAGWMIVILEVPARTV